MVRFTADGADEMDEALWCLEWPGGGRPWLWFGFAPSCM